MPALAKIGTQIFGGTINKNVSSTTITASVDIDELTRGALYSVDASGVPITITVNSAPVGTEYHFFVTDATEGVVFTSGAATIWAPNNFTFVDTVYTHITVKFIQESRAALISSWPLTS